MLWWIVAALIVGPMVLVAAVGVSLRDRVAELHRVRELAQERMHRLVSRLNDQAAALQPRAAQLADRAGELARRGSGKLLRYT